MTMKVTGPRDQLKKRVRKGAQDYLHEGVGGEGGRSPHVGTFIFHTEAWSQPFAEYSVRSDEGLTLETSAFQSLYGGQFTLSTLLINQIFVYHSPTEAAPQFL